MKPRAPDLFEYAHLTETVSTPSVTVDFLTLDPFNPLPFEFAPGPECEPRGIETVPAILRLPGEDGYVKLDRFGRVRGSVG